VPVPECLLRSRAATVAISDCEMHCRSAFTPTNNLPGAEPLVRTIAHDVGSCENPGFSPDMKNTAVPAKAGTQAAGHPPRPTSRHCEVAQRLWLSRTAKCIVGRRLRRQIISPGPSPFCEPSPAMWAPAKNPGFSPDMQATVIPAKAGIHGAGNPPHPESRHCEVAQRLWQSHNPNSPHIEIATSVFILLAKTLIWFR